MSSAVLVLNQNYEPLNVCGIRRALVLLLRDKAQSLEIGELLVRSTSEDFLVPSVIRLLHLVKRPVFTRRLSRREVFWRDKFTCQYCSRRHSAAHMSIDHVLPRSKGGQTNWENCVLACVKCNARKADRTLKDSGLRLRHKPKRPRWTPYMNLAAEDRLVSWRRFTPESDWNAGFAGLTG